MIDIKFLRENPDVVKENIKKKFQDHKLVLVDEVLELDAKNREAKLNGDDLRSKRNLLSSEIGNLMRQGKKDEAESIKAQVQEIFNKDEKTPSKGNGRVATISTPSKNNNTNLNTNNNSNSNKNNTSSNGNSSTSSNNNTVTYSTKNISY